MGLMYDKDLYVGKDSIRNGQLECARLDKNIVVVDMDPME